MSFPVAGPGGSAPPAAAAASSSAPSSPVATVVNQPSYIERGRLKFLVMDAPHYDNVGRYVKLLKQRNCVNLVRTCEKTYDEVALIDSGITPHALVFPDGEPPPKPIIREWLALVDQVCLKADGSIAIHCLAGLGRAPVLVAIALVELGDMSNVSAIELVRAKRKGAINKKQLDYLISYRKQHRKKKCCGLF